jgi:hypothetical protein
VLFGRGDFKAKAGAFDDKTRWLLGDEAVERFDALIPDAKAPRREFPLGGYWILGDRFATADEVRIVADAGPLGFLAIAAHGHADALAFTLSVGGREVLIDPGTYAYHTQATWRDYFRGTSAHNTVRVDGLDQSVIGGNFLWLRHAHARLERFESTPVRDSWTASHSGYERLADPVRHRRSIVFDKRARTISVRDRLECRLRHRVEVFWHAAEDWHAEREGDRVVLRGTDLKVSLTMTAPSWVAEIVRGRETPPLGWCSRRFDEKTPCSTLVWAGEIEGTTELLTLIRIENFAKEAQ